MNREAVIGEWRRSREALGAAETLMRSGCASDAVSRARDFCERIRKYLVGKGVTDRELEHRAGGD